MWSHFYVGQLLLGLEPDLEYGLHTSRTPLDNSDFFFSPSNYQLKKKSFLVMVRIWVYFLFSVLEICMVLACAGFVCTLRVSLKPYVQQLFCIWSFLGVIHHHWHSAECSRNSVFICCQLYVLELITILIKISFNHTEGWTIIWSYFVKGTKPYNNF